MTYRIRFADTVVEHLRWLDVAERRRVLDAIEVQLSHEPLSETRNRKPLRPNPVAPWELRVGKLRVFYEVAADDPEVDILAIGKKEGQTLRIGGKEIAL